MENLNDISLAFGIIETFYSSLNGLYFPPNPVDNNMTGVGDYLLGGLAIPTPPQQIWSEA